jgi:hypothetical protein
MLSVILPFEGGASRTLGAASSIALAQRGPNILGSLCLANPQFLDEPLCPLHHLSRGSFPHTRGAIKRTPDAKPPPRRRLRLCSPPTQMLMVSNSLVCRHERRAQQAARLRREHQERARRRYELRTTATELGSARCVLLGSAGAGCRGGVWCLRLRLWHGCGWDIP